MSMDCPMAIGFRTTGSCSPGSINRCPLLERIITSPLLISLRFGCITGCPPPRNFSNSGGASASQFLGACRRSSWQGSPRYLGRVASDLHGIWDGLQRKVDVCSAVARSNLLVTRVRALPENSSSLPDPLASSWTQRYHPSEEIRESVPQEDGEEVCLTDAETARTLIEVNRKATLMFSGLTDDEVHETIIWPDLPYLTDEHGGIYFEVNNNEDILETLIADDKLVQVIIGLNNIKMLKEMEISEPSDFDFGIEEIISEDSDIDDDYDEDVFTILEDEEDNMISAETSSDWANLETMQSSHPMYFARKIAEVVSNINIDWMDQPSSSIVVQGLLRPAFVEEHSFIKKHLLVDDTSNDEVRRLGKVVEDNIEEELDKDQSLHGGTAFYMLEMISIQLISAYGTQSSVKVQDFRKARPDVIVHYAASVISRLKAGGEKTIQALKSLCWRHKSIRVEEAALIWVDSLGFDLRVCSGTQIQTLRFAFNTRATSQFGAERQLHDLLFPRFQHMKQNWQQAHQKEC